LKETNKGGERFDRSATARKWLTENVVIIKKVHSLTLKNITFQVDPYAGAFDAVINGTEFPFEFSGTSNANGRITVSSPIACSPCGVPASYSLLEAPRDMYSEICKRLEEHIPPLIPLGLDKKTGKIVAYRDQISERITDMPKVLKAIALFQRDGFAIKVK
jgi:hypothetical protein